MNIGKIDTTRVAELTSRLIQFDTSNFGDDPRTQPEAEAAEFCFRFLTELGYEVDQYESLPGRMNLVVKVEGRDRSQPALVVHGHLDVVPAIAEDWSVDPFAGEIKDGYVWGRGAVDMKNMVAMMLTVLQDMKLRSWQPERDLIVLFLADEEAGGMHGAHWMVDHHPDIFEGATQAVSEVGGYSVTVGGRRLYLIQTGEKGLHWLRAKARGTAGHGSQVNHDNPITTLSQAMAAIGTHTWPQELTVSVETLLRQVADIEGVEFSTDNETIDRLVEALGPAARFVGATLSTRANPTQLDAGYKVNVIPGLAEAGLDLRPIPGQEVSAMRKLEELAGPKVSFETVHQDDGYEVPFDSPIVSTMIDALKSEDPQALVAPYLLSAGTDNKALLRLGIDGYGFVPCALPADFDFPAMFHGVDERVPISTLEFGTRVLAKFLYGQMA